jgi:hypothetical protein
MSRIIVGVVAIVVSMTVVGGFGWAVYDLYLGHLNHRAHTKLKLGMSVSEVREVVGREPDCIVRVLRSRAWLFGGAYGIDPCPQSVDAPSDLPRAYNSIQVLIGPSGRVTAFTLDGESCVLSAKGAAKGQSMAELPLGVAIRPCGRFKRTLISGQPSGGLYGLVQ